jgi:hypothetical protein
MEHVFLEGSSRMILAAYIAPMNRPIRSLLVQLFSAVSLTVKADELIGPTMSETRARMFGRCWRGSTSPIAVNGYTRMVPSTTVPLGSFPAIKSAYRRLVPPTVYSLLVLTRYGYWTVGESPGRSNRHSPTRVRMSSMFDAGDTRTANGRVDNQGFSFQLRNIGD